MKTNGITFLKKHVNTKHSIIYKKFGEEINNPLNRNMKRQLAKKILNTCLVPQYLMFLSQQILSKRMMRSKKYFGMTFIFGNGDSFALTVCGEHVIKTFDHAFLFFITIPFMKEFFIKCFARQGGENQTNVCIVNACKLSFYQFHRHWLPNDALHTVITMS
jgi:hypothetical protein